MTRGVEIIVKNKIKLDLSKIADVVAAQVIGKMQRRTKAGRDIHGQPFAPYSSSYQATLARGGESTAVDLWVTGALVNDIRLLDRQLRGDVLTMTFGIGAGTSEKVMHHYARDKHGEVRERLDKKAGAYRPVTSSTRTGERSPPHNVLGALLHHGTPTMPARPFLGLTPEERKQIAALLRNEKLWKSGH